MKHMPGKWILLPLFVATALLVHGQNRRPETPPPPTTPPAGASQGPGGQGNARPGATPAAKGPKPYKEVITEKAVSQTGVVKLHQVEDKYFMEIPNNLLGRELLVVNRISRGAAGVKLGGQAGFAGDIISESVISFNKGPEDKVFLNKISYRERSTDSTEGMFRSVVNSNIQPIIHAFDIKAFGKDSASAVVEITPLITGDNDLFFFDGNDKRSFGLGGVQPDKSYIVSVHTYPTNLNIRTVKTYSRSASPGIPGLGGGRSSSSDPVTFELNSSILLLAKTPMKARLFDDRVGYFPTSYVDYDLNPQGVKNVVLARRWRLEPKPEDVEKYKSGQLVEPVKQIVYYIDPTTPKKWVPYLIMGVNDWQVAFEKAGFKNAIVAKMAPTREEDSTWSLEDARYSAIVYKPSEVANASGPNTQDPRSGEILETHINWYHNVMRLLRDWYFIQAANIDEGARQLKFDDALMGQLIRFVSSHEVGHTLGLRHNFGSSSTVPVEKLRDKAWVEVNGHTPSIMDYARFNYVAQPEDGMAREAIFPRIGDYDKWAIEWGYKWIPEAKTPQEETPILNKLVVERLKNPRLWWGDGEMYSDDPRAQSEDLGDNAMKASHYGVKNLQRIIPNLATWTREPNTGYDDLAYMYNQVSSQFGRYVGHVSRNIGGIERTPKTVEQPGPVYTFTAKVRQKEAMKWLHDYVFTTPTWLISPQVTSLTNLSPQTTIQRHQNSALNNLINSNTATKLQRFEAEKPSEAYTINEMMTDLRKGIFSELPARKPVDIYRRALQKSFTEKVIGLLPSEEPAPSSTTGGFVISFGGGGSSNTGDLISVAKAQLRTLLNEIKAAYPLIADSNTKMHLADLQDRIQNALDIK